MRARFNAFWKEKLSAAGISLNRDITSYCFAEFSMQFMQNSHISNQLIFT